MTPESRNSKVREASLRRQILDNGSVEGIPTLLCCPLYIISGRTAEKIQPPTVPMLLAYLLYVSVCPYVVEGVVFYSVIDVLMEGRRLDV
jgi:hypothetical protein